MTAMRVARIVFVLILASGAAFAQDAAPEVATSTENTPASESELNAKLTELLDAVNSNDLRLIAIESTSFVSDLNGLTGKVELVGAANIAVAQDSGTIAISANIDGGNAATLDTIDSSQFLRSDVADTFSSDLTVGGDIVLSGALYMYGQSLFLHSEESVNWDSANTQFYFTDDIKVQNNAEANNLISIYDVIANDDIYVTDYLYFGGSTAEYIKFNSASTRYDISDDIYVYGNVALTGELNIGTGTANMIPVAYAMVYDSPAGTPEIYATSGNVGVVYNATYSRYEVSFADFSYSWTTCVAIGSSTGDRVVTFGGIGDDLIVYVRDISGGGSLVKGPFYFAVYKP